MEKKAKEKIWIEDFYNDLSIETEKKAMKEAEQSCNSVEFEHHQRCLIALQGRGLQLKDLKIRLRTLEEPYRKRMFRSYGIAICSLGFALGIFFLLILFN